MGQNTVERYFQRQTDMWTEIQTNRQTYRQSEKQTDRQRDRQASDNKTNRLTEFCEFVHSSTTIVCENINFLQAVQCLNGLNLSDALLSPSPYLRSAMGRFPFKSLIFVSNTFLRMSLFLCLFQIIKLWYIMWNTKIYISCTSWYNVSLYLIYYF